MSGSPPARDFEKNPYTPCEARVAAFWFKLGVGGGDDPIGSLIASHEALAVQRFSLEKLLAAEQSVVNEIIMSIALGAGGEFGG